MPTPTIPAGNLFMNATLYTGNGTTQTITNGVAGASFQPDLVWGKDRTNSANHGVIDVNRGISNWLGPNVTNAEGVVSGSYVTAFNSNGFTVGTGGVYNASGDNYVAWNWKAGGAATTIAIGQYSTSPNVPSIASSVSANTTSGFSVVTYTGTGANATVGHGLGVAPSMVIIKNRTVAATAWNVYQSSIPSSNLLSLNSTVASFANTNRITAVSATTFSIGTDSDVNGSTNSHVAYCWTPIAGYSAFGSYTGNGSADGPFIYLGFRPKFFMMKNTSAGTQWGMFDSSRFSYNGMNNPTLYANVADAETSNSENYGDFLSNGFKIRATNGNINGSGNTIIYMAFAEVPFKFANGR